MEHAYGLAIILCMIMTTILLNFYLIMKRVKLYFIVPLITIYLIIEFSFLAANTRSFEGGYVTLFIALSLISVMTIWYLAKKINKSYTKIVKIEDYKKVLVELSADLSIPKYATHLVYMTNASRTDEIEEK
jgi:KUP system potassium uptake protein